MHASLLGFCLESLVLGDDLLGQAMRLVRGIDVTPDSTSIEAMKQVCLGGPGHYLGSDQTLKLMQTEYIYPDGRQPDVARRNGTRPESRCCLTRRLRARTSILAKAGSRDRSRDRRGDPRQHTTSTSSEDAMISANTDASSTSTATGSSRMSTTADGRGKPRDRGDRGRGGLGQSRPMPTRRSRRRGRPLTPIPSGRWPSASRCCKRILEVYNARYEDFAQAMTHRDGRADRPGRAGRRPGRGRCISKATIKAAEEMVWE